MAGLTDWVTYTVVLGASHTAIVSNADTLVDFIECSVVCTVVTVAGIWSMAVGRFIRTVRALSHAVRVADTSVGTAVFFTVVFIAYAFSVLHVRVVNALFTIRCVWSEAS